MNWKIKNKNVAAVTADTSLGGEVISRNVVLIGKPMVVYHTHYFFNCFIPNHLKATGTLEKALLPLGRNRSGLHLSFSATKSLVSILDKPPETLQYLAACLIFSVPILLGMRTDTESPTCCVIWLKSSLSDCFNFRTWCQVLYVASCFPSSWVMTYWSRSTSSPN